MTFRAALTEYRNITDEQEAKFDAVLRRADNIKIALIASPMLFAIAFLAALVAAGVWDQQLEQMARVNQEIVHVSR